MRLRMKVLGPVLAGGAVAAGAMGVVAAQAGPGGPGGILVQQAGEDERQAGGHLAGVAELLGLELGDLHSQLREGATLAEIAAANGSSAQAVIDLLLAELETKTGEPASDKAIERITDAVNEGGALGRGHGRVGPGHRGLGVALSTAAETIGISEADLRAALREGGTLAEVAAANGSSAQAVIDALAAQLEARTGEAASEEQLARITNTVNERFRVRHGQFGEKIETVATTIGISVEDLHAALRGGSSIAEVAEGNGVPLETVVAALIAEFQANNPDAAAEEIAEKTAQLTERFQQAPPASGERRGPRGFRFGPRGDGAPQQDAGAGGADVSTTL